MSFGLHQFLPGRDPVGRLVPRRRRAGVNEGGCGISGSSNSSEHIATSGALLGLAEGTIGFGVWKWDFEERKLECSDELFRIYGMDPRASTGEPTEFLAQLRLNENWSAEETVQTAIAERLPFTFESNINRVDDGAERTLYTRGEVIRDESEHPVSLVGLTYDVTEQAEALRQLDSSESRLHAIIDNIPSLVVVKDLDGRYVMANAVAEEAARVEPGGVIGLTTQQAFPDVVESQLPRDEVVAETGEAIHAVEMFVRDGVERIYQSVTFPLRNDDGTVVETCTVVTDTTERSEREAEDREKEDWRDRIEGAISEGRMLVFAQPIIDPRTGSVESSELLVRMREAGTVLPPADFVDAAEELGLIQMIDVWMVQQAQETDLPVHVNISAVTLDDPAAREELIDLLGQGKTENLIIEITETASLDSLHAAQEFTNAAKDLGCRIALDDFGVGFGSFTYLRSLPVDLLKIDRRFVTGLAGTGENRRLVEGIVGLARGLGLRTIAEGVEDQKTSDVLVAAGVDLVQGYHYGRPAPLDLNGTS